MPKTCLTVLYTLGILNDIHMKEEYNSYTFVTLKGMSFTFVFLAFWSILAQEQKKLSQKQNHWIMKVYFKQHTLSVLRQIGPNWIY